MSAERTFSAGFLFCGLGAGARGFIDASARLGKHEARFRNLGGIDNDPLACEDFEKLSGGAALCADLAKLTPPLLRDAWGDEAPDAVFLSPPCKGFSGLLSKKSAEKEKYQALNRLVLQGMFLICETWARPPTLIVLENVPRISTRGAPLLGKVRQLLAGYGYLFHEATHDCGEIGGLAQHRRRYLLVARLPSACGAYIYRPSKKRVRACGEVLGELPLPEHPDAGELHQLPRISWLNWLRLACIPPGGDWRDLPGMAPEDPEARKAWEQRGEKRAGAGKHWFKGKYGVTDWEKPSRTVVGGPSNGASAVADPRLGLKATADGAQAWKGRPGLFGVNDWKEPAPTVTGKMTVSGGHGTAAVADPRVPPELITPLKDGQERREHWQKYDVRGWNQPARTVAGSGTNGGFGVADPRMRFGHCDRVTPWDEPVGTITHSPAPSSGAAAVADPRLADGLGPMWSESYGVVDWKMPAPTVRGASNVRTSRSAIADPRGLQLGDNPTRHRNKYAVGEWTEPAPTVIGATRPGSGGASVADPRALAIGCRPRGNTKGPYGVLSWDEAAATVTGTARIDNGSFAIADPRKPPGFVPVIVSPTDGTWHRPLTTLELAALQGLPPELDGKPLKLAGRSVAKWRERIGNAVPVQAAMAIAETLLTALLAASLGTWTLGSTGIWVREDGLSEDEANAPFEQLEACDAA